jgi:hypothetical protein
VAKTKAKTTMISFRAPPALVRALDRYLKHLQEEVPGGNWSRSSAAMNLVAKGLQEREEGRR